MGDRGKVSSTLTAAYIVVTRMEVLDSHRQSSLICSACIVSILLMDVELAASTFSASNGVLYSKSNVFAINPGSKGRDFIMQNIWYSSLGSHIG